MNAYFIIAACVAIVTLIGTAVGVGIAWGTLSTFQKTHEARDTERFAEITATLKEMRDDVKMILTAH